MLITRPHGQGAELRRSTACNSLLAGRAVASLDGTEQFQSDTQARKQFRARLLPVRPSSGLKCANWAYRKRYYYNGVLGMVQGSNCLYTMGTVPDLSRHGES